MIDTFISGEGWNSIFKKTTKTDKKQFNCPICKKIFISEKNLNAHKEKYHTKDRYLCDNCGYNATDRTTLDEHMKDHTVKEKDKSRYIQHNFCCNICDFATTDKNALEEHQRSHAKKEYVCGNYEFTTELRNKIKEHIKDTHGEKEEQKLIYEEPEEMEIDEVNGEEEERKLRSEMQDKKIIENQRKRDEEEHMIKFEKEETERKKAEAEKEKQQEEKVERRKRKASIKQQKKKIKRKLNKYPPNVTEIPENVKHLVDEGALQL